MAEKVKQYRHPDDPITLDELKGFLWAAATHLRGQIDAAGYKEYIFPLLFFKRISDVYYQHFPLPHEHLSSAHHQEYGWGDLLLAYLHTQLLLHTQNLQTVHHKHRKMLVIN